MPERWTSADGSRRPNRWELEIHQGWARRRLYEPVDEIDPIPYAIALLNRIHR